MSAATEAGRTEAHLQVDIMIDPKNITAFLAGTSGVGISLGGNVGLVCRDREVLAALAGACESGAALLAAADLT